MAERRRYLAGFSLVVGFSTALGTCAGQQPALAPAAADVRVIARSRPLESPTTATPTRGAPLTPATGSAPQVADDGLTTLPPIGSVPQPSATVQRVAFSSLGTPLPESNRSEASPSSLVPMLSSGLTVEMRGPAEVVAGASLRYEIVVRNPGTEALAGVRIEEQLPIGTKLLSVEPAPDVQGDRLFWNLGNLEGHGERRLRLELQPGGPREFLAPTATFTAAVGPQTKLAAPTALMPTAPNATTFVLSQTAPESVQRGTSITLRVRVANNGTTPLTHVVLREKLPSGLQHPAGGAIEADVGTLAPGQTKTLLLDVVALQTGRLVCDITALADGGWQAHAATSLEVADAAFGVEIGVPDRVEVAQNVEVRLDVFNPSAAPAVNARLRQMVPDGFDVLDSSSGGTFDLQTRSVAWELGNLQPGEHRLVAFKVRSKFAGVWKWDAWLNADGRPEVKANHMSSIVDGN